MYVLYESNIMGIDYVIESTIDQEWNKTMGWDAYCKSSWSNTEWKKIFKLIWFDPNRLYDHCPNYWTCEQLEFVLKRLKNLKITHTQEEIADIDNFEFSINRLIELFTIYVDKKCRLVVL